MWISAGYAVLAIVMALAIADPFKGRPSEINTVGDDWTTYERLARDIRVNGILMPGNPEPFYQQIGYPYALALLRSLAGEGQYPLVLVQALLVFCTGWLLAAIARRIAGTGAAILTLLMFLLFSYAALRIYMARALSDVLYWFLLALFSFCMVVGGRWVGAVALALATFVRSTALPLTVFFVRSPWMVAPTVLVWTLVTLRNYATSGQFAIMPTSGRSYYVGLAGQRAPFFLENLQQLFIWPGPAAEALRGTLWTAGTVMLLVIFVLSIRRVGAQGRVLVGVVLLHVLIVAVWGVTTYGYGVRVAVPIYLFMMPHVGAALWFAGSRLTRRFMGPIIGAGGSAPDPVI